MATMFPLAAGSLSGLAAVWALYLRWSGRVSHRGVVALAWLGIAVCMLLWAYAYNADVGTSLATLWVMGAGLVAVFRAPDIAGILPFPETRKAKAESAARINWSRTAARTFSTVVLSPVVGLIAGVCVWAVCGGHDATRFVSAVVVFLISYAVLQIWGASAVRPWRALALMAAIGAAMAFYLWMRF